MTSFSYPDENSWWNTFTDEVNALYGEAGRHVFDDGKFKWFTRTAYDIGRPDGLAPDASKAKHLAELREVLGLSAPAPHPVPARGVGRPGLVRAEGRAWVDDLGRFFPLGATLFWALRGWKFERDRLCQQLAFLQAHNWDFVRILGEVGWLGNEIDPAWPDYPQVLADFIDTAYDQYGLRTELTLLGGGTRTDPLALAHTVAQVVRDRPHKILDLEAANEFYNNRISEETVIGVARYLRGQTPCLVACSSPDPGAAYPVGTTYVDVARRLATAADASLVTMHMDRGFGDGGWRAVRQPWDLRDLPWPVTHNEPIGPRSSVAQATDPWLLTMLRAVGIACGVGAYVLHNAAGVFGRVDPARYRPANLWEVPGINEIMDAVRRVDPLLPDDLENWRRTSNFWHRPNPEHPLPVDTIWPDGADHGVTRNYAAVRDGEFVAFPLGLRQYAIFTAVDRCAVEVYNPITTELVLSRSLDGGEKLTLQGPERGGLPAYIIRGRW